MPYQCIFFDLDHTLWDFETNSTETLCELYAHYQLKERGAADLPVFLQTFAEINKRLWVLYDQGLIHRDVIRYERFKEILEKVNVPDYELSLQLSEAYVKESPRKGNLMPHAEETLRYLHTKYPMYIITNGFAEIQSIKLSSSKIDQYFKRVITSEEAQHKKPSKEIFEYALRENGFKAHETIMIGDNLTTDIQGAKNASIDTVYYNPHKEKHGQEVNYEITSLKELCGLL